MVGSVEFGCISSAFLGFNKGNAFIFLMGGFGWTRKSPLNYAHEVDRKFYVRFRKSVYPTDCCLCMSVCVSVPLCLCQCVSQSTLPPIYRHLYSLGSRLSCYLCCCVCLTAMKTPSCLNNPSIFGDDWIKQTLTPKCVYNCVYNCV